MTVHELKCWPKFFNAILDGSKRFEIRIHDRDFKVGDTLVLKEWLPASMAYTGRECRRLVSYVLDSDGFPGLTPSYCALGLAVQLESPRMETGVCCDRSLETGGQRHTSTCGRGPI